MNQPDLFEARARRDVGMQRAADHAGDAWTDVAYRELLAFAARGAEFLIEDFVQAFKAAGHPAPPDGRAFGAIVIRARRAGVIRRVGAAPAKTSNCSLKPVWARA